MNSRSSDIQRNPFAVKTPENLAAEEVVELFVPYPEYDNLQVAGHQFLHGHRGSGKSMMLRMLLPDCQMRARRCGFTELPFLGVYISVKATDINSPEYTRLELEPGGFVLSEHVLVGKMLSAFFVTLRDHCGFEGATGLDAAALRKFISDSLFKRLANAGWEPMGPEELADKMSVLELLNITIDVIDKIQAHTTKYVKSRAFTREVIPYRGPLLGFYDVLLPVFADIAKCAFFPSQSIYLLIDDADNLSLQQTKVLNSWVSYRSTNVVSLKISTQLNYKTRSTSSDMMIEAPHDFSEINFTSVHTGSVKEQYPKLVAEIVRRRLVRFGLPDPHPEQFFPEDVNQVSEIASIAAELREKWAINPTGGFRPGDDAYRQARPEYIRRLSSGAKQGARYKYSGFEQLVHISSGIIRFFLEPAARMFADQQTKNGDNVVSVIDPEIQDDAIRQQSNELLLKKFEELKTDMGATDATGKPPAELEKLSNVINGIGSLFQAHIMDGTASQRRVFSFTLSDSPPEEVRKILRLGVNYGFFYLDSIGKKSGMGREELYVLSRRLAPAFKLDPVGFSNHLSVTSAFIADIAERPTAFVNRLRRDGVANALGVYQQQLPLSGLADE
jgi:hypothetical protein